MIELVRLALFFLRRPCRDCPMPYWVSVLSSTKSSASTTESTSTESTAESATAAAECIDSRCKSEMKKKTG